MSISTTDPVRQLIQKQSDTRANHEHDCDLTDFEVSIEGNSPPPQKQYKIKPEAEASEHGTVKELETRSIVRKCGPVTNSPRLPVPKGLSQATPNVANPATILIQLPDALSSGLDIKNGFLSLYPKDQGKLASPINQTQNTVQSQARQKTQGGAVLTQRCRTVLTKSQEIRNLRLQKNPKHDINYAELLSSFTMYISTKCTVCIGFFVVVKNQVIKWDHIVGYMTLENTETLFTSCICCHETTSYILCTCNILKTFSQNNSRLISIQSLHGNELFHLQWSDLSGKSQLLPRDHLDVSPWWNDTFYEENTCALTETMDLVQTNLAKKTAEILPSSSTHSAQYTYTGWDWVFRGCVFASMVTFTVTLIQCCYVRCALRSLCKATHFVPSLVPRLSVALKRLPLRYLCVV
uniref:Uncharacterized protein n=1 Tax=Astyanax mexicanus TaxID=7994 RepID=A0A3B1JS90_ASTMX